MSLLQSPQPNRNRGSSISSVASSMLSPITNMLSSPKVDEHNDHDGHVALSSPGTDERKRVELRIGGMTCGACVAAIEGQMRGMEGIQSVQVSSSAERAVVEYNPDFIDDKGMHWNDARIAEEIEDIGFDAEVVESGAEAAVDLLIYGLSNPSLVPDVVREAASLPGVSDVVSPVPYDHSSFVHTPTLTSSRAVVDHLAEKFPNLSFLPTSSENDSQLASLRKHREIARWRRIFVSSAIFAVPNFIVGMMHMYLPFMGWTKWKLFTGIYLGDLVCLCSTIPVQLFLARIFYINAWKSLKHGSATMDVLVVVGTSATFTYSVLSMFFAMFSSDKDYRPQTFFDTSTMSITFVASGRYIENLAKGKTSTASTNSMASSPSSATIFTDPENYHDGAETRKIPTELVQVGDVVSVVPGEKIAADGVVVSGTTTVDESMVTGESSTVPKTVESQVIGGTVNGLGTVTFRVTRAGSDTTLAHIVKLVEDAQTAKPPIQQFADRVAGIFVPIVISLAIVTFFLWLAISIFKHNSPPAFQAPGASKFGVCLKSCISVVVVACPCALGLSTPTAVMVGTGVGAQNGISIKGGRASETARDIKRVVSDKTGTVTSGKMTASEICWAPAGVPTSETGLTPTQALSSTTAAAPLQRHAVLALIALAESRSEHPLAVAIASYGRETSNEAGSPPPSGDVIAFESIPGEGIEATVRQHGTEDKVRVGKMSFILAEKEGEMKATSPQALERFEEAQSAAANVVTYVSIIRGGVAIPVLALALSDAPKPTSAQAIQALRAMGLQVTLLSGDSEATTRAVARQVGIDDDEVYGGVSPKGKATIVRDLAQQGGVAMVGDGINDSPASVASSMGIALGSGTSIAMEAAEVVSMRGDLLDVVAALDLGQAIYNKIKANLLWACCYNICMIPLAMGALLPWGFHSHPMMAAAAMAFSSVSVVLSSSSSKWWRRPANSVPDGEFVEKGGASRGSEEFAMARDALFTNARRATYNLAQKSRTVPGVGSLVERLGSHRSSNPAIVVDDYEAIPLTSGRD